jgi:stage V sporulation protein AD
MTFYYKNVYINETSTVTGPYEKKGNFGKYFDKSYKDLYCGEKSFEKGEIKLVKDSLNILLKKSKLDKSNIDLIVGGDLLNQITASTYGSVGIGDFIGVYGACSSSVLSMIIISNFIESGFINNGISLVSSHNMTSEKQFRYPTEYGAPKKNSSTFTSTGGASCLLSNKKSHIKVESTTLGRIIDYEENDPNDMGRVMAPSAIDTLLRHLKDTNRDVNYYDLILTGDLGKYGMEIVKDYLEKVHNITLSNYNDCGVMLYDLEKQSDVHAGGSGPVCSALVVYSYIYEMMKKKKLKRVLFLATGALFSPLLLYQKENINSICHAISLEVV